MNEWKTKFDSFIFSKLTNCLKKIFVLSHSNFANEQQSTYYAKLIKFIKIKCRSNTITKYKSKKFKKQWNINSLIHFYKNQTKNHFHTIFKEFIIFSLLMSAMKIAWRNTLFYFENNKLNYKMIYNEIHKHTSNRATNLNRKFSLFNWLYFSEYSSFLLHGWQLRCQSL